MPLFSREAFQCIWYLMVISVEVFMYSYWGNEIQLNSQAVAQACYEATFIGTDVRFQKGLILFMQRSQRPIKLTAGKFVFLSLNTFMSVSSNVIQMR